MGLEPFLRRFVGAAETLEAAYVPITIELVGGQAEGAEPLGQLSGVVGRISRFSGVEMHEAPSGSPEHEIVTNIGAVSVDVNSTEGVTVMVAVPDWPAVRVRVFDEAEVGVRLEMATVNSHSVVTLTRTGAEVEPWSEALPAKFAVRL
jgi:hypothetical protein